MDCPVLFLDMDGVMNDHSKLPSGYCGIHPEKVELLNWLFAEVPDLRIVLSTSWRYMILKGEMTLKGFEMLMLIHGIQCQGRVIGYTVADGAVEDEPDHQDALAWEKAGLSMRHKQIMRYVEENGITRFAVVDDLPLDVPNLVQTSYNAGMDYRDACEIKRILNPTPAP
jgi:hypothetical protein